MPKINLGSSIDRMYKQKEKISLLDAKIAKEKSVFNDMCEEVMKCMESESLEESGGKLAKVSLKVADIPSVKDWTKLYAYIKKNNAWDMLQKRVSSAAYKERILDGKKVPGVVTFKKSKLLMRKK